jgi:GNAT superfamily N-acetyltransferase
MTSTAALHHLLADVARGVFPPADGAVTYLPQPSERDAGVIAFTGHSVVFADVGHDGLHALLPPGDPGAPLGLLFLNALSARTGRTLNGIDMLTVAAPWPPHRPSQPERGERENQGESDACDGLAQLTELTRAADRTHPRILRALRHRDQVRAWAVPGGTVLIGRGVAGRWETAVEVDPAARGRGLGRRLARAARRLAPAGEPLWAQIAPGNAASVRAFLSAGFTPVGAEALLVPACPAAGGAGAAPDDRAGVAATGARPRGGGIAGPAVGRLPAQARRNGLGHGTGTAHGILIHTVFPPSGVGVTSSRPPDSRVR